MGDFLLEISRQSIHNKCGIFGRHWFCDHLGHMRGMGLKTCLSFSRVCLKPRMAVPGFVGNTRDQNHSQHHVMSISIQYLLNCLSIELFFYLPKGSKRDILSLLIRYVLPHRVGSRSGPQSLAEDGQQPGNAINKCLLTVISVAKCLSHASRLAGKNVSVKYRCCNPSL